MQAQPGSPDLSRPGRGLSLSRAALERLGIEADRLAEAGGLVVADVATARELAARLNRGREPADATTPGRLFALSLIHQLLISLVDRYRRQLGSTVTDRALGWIQGRLGAERLDATLSAFALLYPPPPVLRGQLTVEDYLAGETGGVANRELLLEALLMLRLANENPAFEPFGELFDDRDLALASDYPEVVGELERFLATLPPVGAEGVPAGATNAAVPAGSLVGGSLIDQLRAPFEEAARSLSEQLAMLRPTAVEGPGPPPDRALLDRVLRGTDLLREEERPIFPPGPGPVEVMRFSPPAPAGARQPEGSPTRPESVRQELTGPERFSDDREWMPRLVLMAKNAFVWLHQLAARFDRPIARLDEIPVEALDELAEHGITGLWLIGVWQRSAASERIKQLCGNPDAAASAYSLDDYRIADELGGEEALAVLTERAAERGLHLASDMVPNHMGIDSRWVLEHPERFLSVAQPPFAGYRFSGPDLSPDPKVGLHLEDHYFDRSDAAVVFQRVERATGEIRYLYHGNDGTSTPWNDTAQLDYLDPAVREAVADTILEVARRFPVIRFDAAMTLARKHVQRLWYPPPGEGGAIPSRSEHGLSQEEFDRRMPEEFWRQVVDRVAREAPDTLLLAEAFWLMESYFVRTLGMHRVYNSAFMHMLRDERNADYRESLANVLEFDPQILQRYVNFMSNPDERTAFDQFGSGDKYFGVCTLMATLPGLPMFGHGQLEGLLERYGMEYRRPYRDERPDRWLLDQHRRRIAPLLARRALFAGAESFRLYDFEVDAGAARPGQAKRRVDPNVFVYSNRAARPVEGAEVEAEDHDPAEAGHAEPPAVEDERALIVFHNHPSTTRGRIRRGLPFAVKTEDGGKLLRLTTLAQELLPAPAAGSSDPRGLQGSTVSPAAPASAPPSPSPSGATLLACRDRATGLEHLFDPAVFAVEGLTLEIGPYQCYAFLDFRPVEASTRWRELAAALAGRGVPSLEEALLEGELLPVLAPFRRALEPSLLARLAAADPTETLDEIERRARAFLSALRGHLESPDGAAAEAAAGPKTPELNARFRQELDAAVGLLARLQRRAEPGRARNERSRKSGDEPGDEPEESVEAFLAAGWVDDTAFRATLVAWLLARRIEALETAMPAKPATSPTATGPTATGEPETGKAATGPPAASATTTNASTTNASTTNTEPPLTGEHPGSLLHRFLIDRQLSALLSSYGVDEQAAIEARLLLRLLARGPAELPPSGFANRLRDPDLAAYLRVHVWEGVEYLHRESLAAHCWWSVLAAACFGEGEAAAATLATARALLARAESAGYRVDRLEDEGTTVASGSPEAVPEERP